MASRNNSNAILALQYDDILNHNNSNSINYLSKHFISVNNGYFTTLGAINGTTNVVGESVLNGPINLQNGTLTLASDMILSNQTTVQSSGNLALRNNAIIFDGNLTFPSGVTIKITSVVF